MYPENHVFYTLSNTVSVFITKTSRFSGLFAGVQASSSVASSFLFLSSIFSDEGRSSYKFPVELDSLFPLAEIKLKIPHSITQINTNQDKQKSFLSITRWREIAK